MQKRYAFPNISKKSYTTVKYGVKTMASFSDCIIFLFLVRELESLESYLWLFSVHTSARQYQQARQQQQQQEQ